MKKNYVLFALMFSTIISLKYSSGPASQVGQGYTGAPGESGTLCSSCHSGGAFGTPITALEITDGGGGTVTDYVPGDTYQVSLTATAESGTPFGYGFQLTVLDGADADVAVFSNPSSNAKISTAANIAGGRTYAEHNGTSATNTFTFEWIAPSGGTGDLTFYYNVNLVNANGGISGDSGGSGFSTAMTESIPTVTVVGQLDVNNAYILPSIDGTVNQVLTTDGNGVVSWMDATTSFVGDSPTNHDQNRSSVKPIYSNDSKNEIDILKNEVKLLKSEIEALKLLIDKLTKG
ncbi:MAG: hypothetical protein ACI86M_002677 [Saprospiraceae bacterium]|jgi:hypothetical protein